MDLIKKVMCFGCTDSATAKANATATNQAQNAEYSLQKAMPSLHNRALIFTPDREKPTCAAFTTQAACIAEDWVGNLLQQAQMKTFRQKLLPEQPLEAQTCLQK